MKAEKCRHRLSTIQQSYPGHMDEMLKELDDLEAKSAELDRREQGVDVETTEEINGVSYEICGNCGDLVGSVYCSTCGAKLIWPENEVGDQNE